MVDFAVGVTGVDGGSPGQLETEGDGEEGATRTDNGTLIR